VLDDLQGLKHHLGFTLSENGVNKTGILVEKIKNMANVRICASIGLFSVSLQSGLIYVTEVPYQLLHGLDSGVFSGGILLLSSLVNDGPLEQFVESLLFCHCCR
jgi:hypothetical protein